MTVLVVTQSGDTVCAPQVIEHIRARGGRAFRFDSDRFPTEVVMRLRHDRDGAPPSSLVDGDETLDLADVTSVWYRRLKAGGCIPETLEEQMRKASMLESRASVLGMIAGLRVFHLDPVWLVRRAGNKQLQLEIAREAGLETPRTLTTNDEDAVREFAARCEGGVVTKMLSSFAIYEDGQEQVVFTNRLTDDDLKDLRGLHLCPMTFQEAVPKRLELRVTVVARRVFAASIDSQRSDRATHDWRRDGHAMVNDWKPYSLPPEVEAGALRVMDAFGLNYGAMDFILTPDGRHVFLEVNPAGEFFWIDSVGGGSISGELAETLLNPSRARENGANASPVVEGAAGA